MPRGRQPNHDVRIANLLDQLRDAIVAREKAAMDARVSAQVRALVNSLDTVRLGGPDTKISVPLAATTTPKAKRKGLSSAGRARQIAAMKAYWAKKRAAKAKKGE